MRLFAPSCLLVIAATACEGAPATVPDTCRDGVVQEDEACDDGDDFPWNECTNECELAVCGDGIVRPETEDCDDGLHNSTSDPRACQTDCTLCLCDPLVECFYEGDSFACGPCPDGWVSVPLNSGSYENVCYTQLLGLEVIGDSLDAVFDPAVRAYTVTVDSSVVEIAFVPTATPGAGLDINGEPATSGVASRAFEVGFGTNVFSIQVHGGRSTLVLVQQGMDVTVVKASNADPGDHFGSSVALDGDTLAVGAPLEAGAGSGVGGDPADDSAPHRGAIYVFRDLGGTWTEEAYLKPTATGETFLGNRVALSGDTLATWYSSDAGSIVDVFRRGAGWSVDATFPGCAELALDGDTLAMSCGGEVRIYRRGATTWSLEATLTGDGLELDAGSALALDGDLLAVDAYDEIDTGMGPEPVYRKLVFQRSGTTWALDEELVGREGEAVLDGDRIALRRGPFGQGQLRVLARTGSGWVEELATSVPSDVNAVALGLPYVATGNNYGDRAVWLRALGGTGWDNIAYIRDWDLLDPDRFGDSLAVDANLLAVGSPTEDTVAPDSGAVYLFLLP